MKTIEEFIIDHITELYESGKAEGRTFNGEIESEQGLLLVTANVQSFLKEKGFHGDRENAPYPDTFTFEVEIVDIWREKHYLKKDEFIDSYSFIDSANEWGIYFYKGNIHFDFGIDVNRLVKYYLDNGYEYCTRQELSDFYAEQTKDLNLIAKEI